MGLIVGGPHVQKIEAEIRDKQLQFDETKATTQTLAPVQRFARL